MRVIAVVAGVVVAVAVGVGAVQVATPGEATVALVSQPTQSTVVMAAGHQPADHLIPPDVTGTPPAGTPIGTMTIPRLGTDVLNTPLAQSVELDVLATGIGHFSETALPGQAGNFAVAGHRATHTEPLRYIDLLQAGDLVYVQTPNHWYTYRLFRDKLVSPDDYWVVGTTPLNDQPGVSDHLLTIVTCNPRWGSTERWIWWGELVDSRTREQGPPEFKVSA